jgi:hypothetical protein
MPASNVTDKSKMKGRASLVKEMPRASATTTNVGIETARKPTRNLDKYPTKLPGQLLTVLLTGFFSGTRREYHPAGYGVKSR